MKTILIMNFIKSKTIMTRSVALATCVQKPKVLSSSPAASYV